MSRLSPYIEPRYPLTSITRGLYTSGNEYVHYLDISKEYVGLYHRLPNGELWSESVPTSGVSVRLTEKRFDASDDVKMYNRITERPSSNYIEPIPYYPIVDDVDYELGYVDRYFVQKRTNPRNTIIEIDSKQQKTLNSRNNPGINLTLWNSVYIQWSLSSTFAYDLNRNRIYDAEKKFPGISNYLKNPLEFVK